jgi:signal transduction histidine kinase
MSLFSIAGLLLGITCLLLAGIVAKNGRSKLHFVWAFFNVAVAIWGIGCFIVGQATSESTALFGWKFAHVGGLFVAVLFYHMVCIFCNLNRPLSIITAYSLGILFLWFNIMTDHFINKTRVVFDLIYNDATTLYYISNMLWLLLVLWSFMELLKFLPKTQGIKRTQTLYIIGGFLIGFVGGASTFLPEFNIDILYPFGNITIPLYCLIATYAILRYRLMDINLAIKKTLVYSLSAGVLTSVFVVLVLSMTTYLSGFIGITSFWITVVAALIIAFLFTPLKEKIQKFIDTLFYKTTYDYYATIQNVSHHLASSFDRNEIYHYIVDTIFTTLKLKSVYLLSEENKDFEITYARSSEFPFGVESTGETIKIARGSEITEMLEGINTTIVKEEVQQLYPDLVLLPEELKPFKGEVVVPIYIDNKLTHLLILGQKQSGDIFTDENIKLLDTIANQTAIALKNAGLYAEKVQSERLASIGMMSATLAHEIKNPLSSIKVFTQLIPERYNDREFRETFSRLVSGEIQRIDGLLSELLDFSKPTPINIGRVHAQKLLDDCIRLVLENFEENGIKIMKTYHGKFNIAGDADRLKQAILNILLNSQQALKAGEQLEVELLSSDNYINMVIKDNGTGIPGNIIDKIFDPFVTTKQRGAGLGLAISKKIIEDHGGSISVESKLGKGTAFRIKVPTYYHVDKGTKHGTVSSVK